MWNPQRAALRGAIQRPAGAFTRNNAPTGLGQPRAGGFSGYRDGSRDEQPVQMQERPEADGTPDPQPQQPQAQPEPDRPGEAPEPPPQQPPPPPQAQPTQTVQQTQSTAPTVTTPVQQAPASWNTDGYAGPQVTAANAAQQAMAGWDQTKWSNADHQTPKYAVGRILSQFAPKAENVGAAVAEIAKAYPGTTLVNGKEKVHIPGVGTIDLMKGFNNGGEAWQWGALTDKDGNSLEGPPARQQAFAKPTVSLQQNQPLQRALMPNMGPDYFSQQGSFDRLQALLARLQSGGR